MSERAAVHEHSCHRVRSILAPALLTGVAFAFFSWTTVRGQFLFLSDQAPAGSDRFTGILNVVWADPNPQFGAASDTRFSLSTFDGQTIPLQVDKLAGTAVSYFGRQVVITGRSVAVAAATGNNLVPEVIAVDTLELDASQNFLQPDTAVVTGTKKVIFLLVKFSDDPNVPHPPVFYTDLINPDRPPAGEVFPATINGFFKKTSWNQFSWEGDVGGAGGLGAPNGWLTLPQPKAYYAPCGWGGVCAKVTTLANDAMAAGRAAGINFSIYDNINFVLSNDLDCCAWGGGVFSSIEQKSFGATWEPPWGQETETYVHEMGHSIGLPHSGWRYYAYDSPWDIMSSHAPARTVACGSYISANNGSTSTLGCSEPGDGYISAHKDYLGWIPPGNVVTVPQNSTVTVTLEGLAMPLGSTAKMIKVCLAGFPCTGSQARYVTVEARVKNLAATSQYDNSILGDGIILHSFQSNRPAIGGPCFFNSQSGWAVPIDATPGDYDSAGCNVGGRSYPNYALYNAQWLPGQTYQANNLRIEILSRSGSTYVVRVGPIVALRTQRDFDGDGKSDLAVYRPSTGEWWVRSQGPVQWGRPGDVPAPGDYDGNGSTDVAVYRPSTGTWWVCDQFSIQWGTLGDLPVPADYNGDGRSDVAVFRPSTGQWWVRNQFTAQWGQAGDIPVPGDYTGDGVADLAVFRPSTGQWWIRGLSPIAWGGEGDVPVPGDYDGDGMIDVAVYRPSTGQWLVRNQFTVQLGAPDDVPVPGDYDGDGATDVAVFRPATGEWLVRDQFTVAWGGASDWVLPRPPGPGLRTDGDYTRDGRADAAVYRPSTGEWWVRGQAVANWGNADDIPVPGDYNGDAVADVAVFRPSTGTWWVRNQFAIAWGASGDVPVPGDYNGDGITDVAVFQPSTGRWFVHDQFTIAWGVSGDIPVPGDYTGDGRTDIAIYRPGTGQWWIQGQGVVTFGITGDIPVPCDYNGDGVTDIAVFRPSTGQWFVRNLFTVVWGGSGDTPVPADFNGDGVVDIAVYRPATGEWWIRNQATITWGARGDTPVIRPIWRVP